MEWNELQPKQTRPHESKRSACTNHNFHPACVLCHRTKIRFRDTFPRALSAGITTGCLPFHLDNHLRDMVVVLVDTEATCRGTCQGLVRADRSTQTLGGEAVRLVVGLGVSLVAVVVWGLDQGDQGWVECPADSLVQALGLDQVVVVWVVVVPALGGGAVDGGEDEDRVILGWRLGTSNAQPLHAVLRFTPSCYT
jgi:hypothetical protein